MKRAKIKVSECVFVTEYGIAHVSDATQKLMDENWPGWFSRKGKMGKRGALLLEAVAVAATRLVYEAGDSARVTL